MKKNLFARVLYILIAIIQISIIVGVFVVQYLTKKKAGVLHHIYYRKYQFENGLFSPENISKQNIAVLVIILLFTILFVYLIKSNKSTFYKVQASIGLLLSILLYVVINNAYFISKVAYHYFIMAFALVLLIQMIVILVVGLLKKLN
ncbi:MAG: hypothetical protein ACRC92_14690 [Peptostreptococcaceae bacterium]